LLREKSSVQDEKKDAEGLTARGGFGILPLSFAPVVELADT
jgi:hypothetical protein